MYLNDRLYEIDQLCGHRDVGNDFDLDDLTTDGLWYYLDLSSIVGKHETLVTLHVDIEDNVAGNELAFKCHGYTNHEAVVETAVANIDLHFQVSVKTDSNGVIDYKATDTTWTAINITVSKWRPVYVIGG